METFNLELYPNYTISVGLFTNVSNASVLRSKLMKGELNSCALLNVQYIPDILPILVACNKSVHCHTNSSMKSRTVHTELLCNLSPTNSIKGALKRFGITDNEQNILCVSVTKDTEIEGVQNFVDIIEGTVTSLDHLESVSNVDKIKELYKISDEELTVGSLADAVVMRISTKDAL